MKTRSFDRKAVKKISPESCPIRTRGAKKGNKERKQKMDINAKIVLLENTLKKIIKEE